MGFVKIKKVKIDFNGQSNIETRSKENPRSPRNKRNL